jgi:hypothetical protein
MHADKRLAGCLTCAQLLGFKPPPVQPSVLRVLHPGRGPEQCASHCTANRRDYLNQLCRSRKDGARISTYYAWSFMDNFEWLQGYTERFGITHVDFASPGLERTVKDSGYYLSDHFFKSNRK